MKIKVSQVKKEKTTKNNDKIEVNVRAIEHGAQNLVNFLVEKEKVNGNDTFDVKGIVYNGNKAELSYALFVNDKPFGVYRAQPRKKITATTSKKWFGTPVMENKKLFLKSYSQKDGKETMTELETFDL